MTRVSILIDNQPCNANPCLIFEHGLCVFIEASDYRILCDTGLSGTFIDNASAMGIDLDNIDFTFISHGHNDHTGGLPRLLDLHPDITVYASSHIFNPFYSTRLGRKRNISIPASLSPQQFTLIDHSQWITPTIAIVACNKHHHRQPMGNIHLSQHDSPDNFDHELSLAIVDNGNLIIISSCSHHGALNIIDACREFTGISKVKAFIGGLHFTDGPHTADESHQFLNDIATHHPDTTFYTGHCTCPQAQQHLTTNPHINIFTTGTEIAL